MTRCTLHRSKAKTVGETPAAASEKTDPAPVDLMLDAEELDCIHAALIIGLGSMGEIERARGVIDAYGRYDELKRDGLLPLSCDPGDGMSEFCGALQAVYRAQRQLRLALEARCHGR